MNLGTTSPVHLSKPIDQAATKMAQIQRDLAVAEAELSLTNAVLCHGLPDQANSEDLKKAVEHSAAIEEKIGEAAGELQQVTQLLHAECSERRRLELGLGRRTVP